MKKTIFASVALLIFSLAAFGQEMSKSEKEVRETVKQWADAILNRDAAALDKILSADLIVTSFDGKTRGKAEELLVVKPNPEVKTISVENEDLRVKIYGKTAVATALTKMQFNISGKDVNTAMRYTAVFVKQNGRWQIVALQTARVAK
jgi:ketosteroid isomerase-like protein